MKMVQRVTKNPEQTIFFYIILAAGRFHILTGDYSKMLFTF